MWFKWSWILRFQITKVNASILVTNAIRSRLYFIFHQYKGYFQWDRQVISSIKPKCYNRLNLRVLYTKLLKKNTKCENWRQLFLVNGIQVCRNVWKSGGAGSNVLDILWGFHGTSGSYRPGINTWADLIKDNLYLNKTLKFNEVNCTKHRDLFWWSRF